MHVLALLLACTAVMLLTACDRQPVEKPIQYSATPVVGTALPIYHLATYPEHNPRNLAESTQPLIDYLNQRVQGVHIELEASRDFPAFEQKFRIREPAILIANPVQTLGAQKAGYHVIAMAGDPEDFRGIFLVRKDADITTPADLKGKVVSYPAPTAFAACIMAQFFLYQHSIDVNRDIQTAYVGSHDSSIMNVYLGKSAAGVTWPPPWRRFQRDFPKEAAQLKVIWETPSYVVSNSVMVRDDVPSDVSLKIRQALLDLTDAPGGRAILAGIPTARFHAASDASYEVVRDYIVTFEKHVRRVEFK